MSSTESNFWQNLDQHLSNFQSQDKNVRRNGLKKLLAEINTKVSSIPKEVMTTKENMKKNATNDDSDDDDSASGDSPSTSPLLSSEIMSTLMPALLLRLSDPVESCRELTYNILTSIISGTRTASSLTPFLPHIVPILLDRLGGTELVEPSEEVRLIAVNFMITLLDSVELGLSPFIDDWIYILAVTLTDPFHEVRKSSCTLTSKSASLLRHVFHYNSERLNKPLVICLTHQQSKVRVAAVRCIGDVLLYGNHKVITDFILPLTLRLFDSQPNVRLAVVDVVGTWMLDYVDRYSYFHNLLPILMTGLCDESPPVQESASKFWEHIGEKYLEENLEEYKDQVDFPSEMPAHYPDDVNRPNFGCRLLTQRQVGKILPGVTNDITDWVETTRQKCAQLLFHLILNCEEAITMHSEPVLQCIFKSCMDPNPVVSKYVLRSASLLAYFVPFPVAWSILSNRLSNNPSESGLAPTSAIISATEKSILKEHIIEVASLLSQSDICHTLKTSRHFWLLQICTGLTGEKSYLENEELLSGAENIFRILLSVLAMTEDGDVKARAIVGLNDLKRSCHYETLDDLFISFSHGVLQDIKMSSDSLWGRVTPENLIFSAILTYGGSSVQKYLTIILDILTNQLDPKKDTEVRLNLFTLLANVLQNYAQTSDDEDEECHRESFEAFVTTIVQDILTPNLVWRAGKSASALRAAATSCLLTILEEKLLSIEICIGLAPAITTGCMSLLEEGYELNRLLAAQCLGRMGEVCQGRWGIDLVQKVYPELLKRLDDEKDDVRVSAGLAMSRIFSNLRDPLSKTHIDFASSALLLHLDDDDENVAAAVAEAIKSLGSFSPIFLIEKCNEFKEKHKSPQNCEDLIEYFQRLEYK